MEFPERETCIFWHHIVLFFIISMIISLQWEAEEQYHDYYATIPPTLGAQ